MHTDHATDTEKSPFKRLVEVNDTLPWWFFAIVVAVGVAVLVYSIV